ADEHVDGLLVLFVSPIMIDAQAVAEAIRDHAPKDKPVLACLMGRQKGREAIAVLEDAGIPVFRYPEDAARIMRLLVRRRALLDSEPGPVPRFKVQRARAAALLEAAPAGWLTGSAAEAVLGAYGIPFPRGRLVRAPKDAVEAAHEIGFPVVIKAEAPGLLHKSEHRAVATRLQNGDEVFAAARDLVTRLARRMPGMMLHVQEMAGGHREVLLGMTRDPRYGPLFVAGIGGTHVEVLRDVAVRIAPLDAAAPFEMFASLKGSVLLGEFRGDPPADVAAAADALLRLQQLVADFPRIAEVEVNPFILDAPGGRSLAVDARLRLEGEP